jgi:type IV pilus assembly protein PilC
LEFVCKVGTPSGEVVERSFTSSDEVSLRAELERGGFYLFAIRRGLVLADFAVRAPRVPTDLLMLFAQELAALLKAGLPLLQSLDVMLERQKHPIFRKSLTTIREKVKGGTALSEAFKLEGGLYPAIFSASLVAGERSGSLETVLRRFVQYLRLNQALRKKAIAASVYPALLMLMMSGLVSILLTWVIPQFQGFFDGLGGELPLATRILLAVAQFARGNFYWILGTVVVTAVTLTVWLKQPSSGLVVDRVLLRVPYLGRLMRMFATSQLARTLSTLLSGGLPLLNSLEVAAESIGNRAMAAAVASAAPQVREGRSLTTALESTGMLENITLEMIKVGEQTGALGDMLNAVAEFYDEELDTRIATVLALVEPIMLVLMAIVVGGMLLAFYLPLFQVFSMIK